MYAVIKTGGNQYRVQPGDLLVVEKLDGEPGANVAFGDVLMLGDGETVTLGAPVVDGASVEATLIETRKGEKVKIFKKIRRQGYRRTRGHRQFESVLRVTSIAGVGKTDKWDGEVDLTPKSVLDARARGLSTEVRAPVESKPAKPAKAAAEPAAEAEAPKAAAKPKAAKAEAGEKKAAPKKAAAKKESDAE
jgi:large subunit ribosomal protein L21